MLTIHLSGGTEMVRAAVNARKDMSILGVTVLTSVDAATLEETGVTEQIDKQVLRLAHLGANAGIDGVVASPLEITALRNEFGERIKIITPGVRPAWSERGDQKRAMTPRDAVAAGADYLVIGRPITAHANPREAVTRILEEIAA
jgi:orotidine-5'-phosphate decarboxylase